jgi:uncharacterized lipoprotein YddW (UPF0748 family)
LLALTLIGATAAAAQSAGSLAIYFYRDGQAATVERPGVLSGDNGRDASTLLTALLEGPTPGEAAAGLVSALPPGSTLAGVAVSGETVTVDLHLPREFLDQALDAATSDALVEQIVKTLHVLGLDRVLVRAEGADGAFLPVSSWLPRPDVPVPTPPPNDEPLPPTVAGQPPVPGQGRPDGALRGKAVWLSAGHGWYWSETLNRWNTQRPNCFGIVEDFSNAEAVDYYLARYLWNAGADVWLVRDRGFSPHEVIVDNDVGAPTYVETGTWLTSTLTGYAGSTYRWTTSTLAPSATATWRPDLPAAGWYPVWAWYRHGANRPIDARYEVHHAGGVTQVSLSQEIHGTTWRYLGEFYFEAGTSGRVSLLSESSDPGQAVIADAVRFGSGPGSIVAPGGTSGRPRWEEAARYWAEYQGAPPEVYADDVTARPLYAEWEVAKGEVGEATEAVYVSWHTNAGGGTGTDSFVHVTEPTTGSLELQDALHAELIADLRAAWDPAWVNRGQKAADLGELRELSTIPGVLLEVAFHDTEDPGDADDLREPYFRQIAARAVYQGIVKYHAARAGTQPHLLPEPPERLAARNSGGGQITLTWAAPPCCDGVVGDAATSYRVYHSSGGRGFGDGIPTAATSLDLTGLAPGSLHFFRVTAVNDGGESFPTAVVAAAVPVVPGPVDLLVVDGFDRLDQAALVPQWESPALGTARRMFLARMNRYDYAVEHATALAACGISFDGAVNEAVAVGDVALDSYDAVDWFVGEESAAGAALDAAERALLADYQAGGGGLLLSGSDVGYDLVEGGRDPAFYRDVLKAAYAGDDAGTYAFAGTAGGPFEGIHGTFDDGTGHAYDVDRPDQLDAVPGARVVATYDGGAGAAVAYDGSARLIYLGFPLEAIAETGVRHDVACAAVDFLLSAGAPAATKGERLINPSFEAGSAPAAWEVVASTGAPVLTRFDDLPAGVEPASGDWVAWLGSPAPDVAASTGLTQAVALPAGDPTVTVSIWWRVEPWAGPEPADTLTAGVYDLTGTLRSPLFEATGASPSGTWHMSRLDLAGLAGQTVQLSVRATASNTAFFVDNVSLAAVGPPGPAEFRALWVDAYHAGIKTPGQINTLVETARAASVNALVVQVRRRGDTYYPSAIDPWAPDATPGFDALAYLVAAAHQAGIEVHAWATTLAIWNDAPPPAEPDHTFNMHGLNATGRDAWLMATPEGNMLADVYYLDPGHPDVVDYMVAVYEELVANYDLDGVHLDRVRYPGARWGYNPTSVARFLAATGASQAPDPADAVWAAWRRDQLTNLMRRIYLATTAIDPHIRVSVALSAVDRAPTDLRPWEETAPYSNHLQDWRGWLAEGILDLGLPMNYRNEADPVWAADFDRWIEWEKDHQYGRGVTVGTGLYLNDLADSMDQWRRVRLLSATGHRAAGLAGYSYATPGVGGVSGRALANAAVGQVLTQTAPTPFLAWKDAPVLGHLSVKLARHPFCPPVDGLVVGLSGPVSRTLHADGSGWLGAVDVSPGRYLLSVSLTAPTTTVTAPITVTAGAVARQTLALPACALHRLYLPTVLRQ